MAVKNNYWKTTLQYKPRHYSVNGWEVHVRIEEHSEYVMYAKNKNKPTNKYGEVLYGFDSKMNGGPKSMM